MRVGGIVVACLLASGSAVADPAAEPEQHAMCLLGSRGATCTTILLAELDGRYGQGRVFQATAEAGLLVNKGPIAFGASAGVLGWSHGLHGDADYEQEGGFVIEARGRLWLGDNTGFDLGIGGGNAGGVADVALEYHDIIGISAGVLAYDLAGSTRLSANVGLRLSLGALVALAAHR
jgi:hypothetical protein